MDTAPRPGVDAPAVAVRPQRAARAGGAPVTEALGALALASAEAGGADSRKRCRDDSPPLDKHVRAWLRCVEAPDEDLLRRDDERRIKTLEPPGGGVWYMGRGAGHQALVSGSLWWATVAQAATEARVFLLSKCDDASVCVGDAPAAELAQKFWPISRLYRRGIRPPRPASGLTAIVVAGEHGPLALGSSAEAPLQYTCGADPSWRGRFVSEETLAAWLWTQPPEDRSYHFQTALWARAMGADHVRAARLEVFGAAMENLAAAQADSNADRFVQLRWDLEVIEYNLADRVGWLDDRRYLGENDEMPHMLPYRDEDEGQFSWFYHKDFVGREKIEEHYRKNRGGTGRNSLSDDRKAELRKILGEEVLYRFVKKKFPRIRSRTILKSLVKYVQVDHIISSGCDAPWNLWLEFKGPNQFFGDTRAMPLKRERVGPVVWAKVVAIFNRLMAAEAEMLAL